MNDIFNVPETCLDDFAISYVTEGEVQLLILPQTLQIIELPRRQVVEDLDLKALLDEPFNQMAADEARASGD